MKVHVYVSPTGCDPTRSLADVVDLWAAGVLPTESTVWVNASAPEPMMWALTDHSHLIYVHRPAEPGYVRLTAGRARWARTYNDTRDRAALDLALDELPGGRDRRVTLVIAHRMPAHLDHPVGVIAGTSHGSRRCALTAGSYRHDTSRTTVIDLPRFRSYHGLTAHGGGGSPVGQVSDFERSNAAVHGMELLTRDLSAAETTLVRAHLDLAYTLRLDAEYLGELQQRLTMFDAWAAGILPLVSGMIANTEPSAPSHQLPVEHQG
ncbi:hypothetical protein [Mycobacterium avium]|uniref:hypothetical protein n=1 Tax=Mycobacterium avium TaxID=1764 RepID=UPI000BAED6D0|nr:hypothetical protein [Mycobacterium avium]PBA08469.1 hypothetical protein CKJ70_26195 [Mycobacterium avium]